MPKEPLPGVELTSPAPSVICNARRPVSRARRIAVIRDTLNIAFLLGIDWLFFHWPATHLPLLDRHDSMVLLIGANVALALYVWLSRAIPRWSARRISGTWCSVERSRFLAQERREQPRQ